MIQVFRRYAFAIASGLLAVSAVVSADMPPISDQARAGLDRALGTKGVYVSEESAYTFTFRRTDVAVRLGGQQLSPNQAPPSWVTFGPSMRREAIVNGEFVVVDAEVNPAIGAALKAGLAVTGLGATILSTQPTLLAINVNGEGTYQSLAASVRRVLDEIQRVRAAKPPSSSTGAASAPVNNAIDPTPLNGVLSMRGTAAEGIYRAAIGRVGLVNGTPIGREMGMSTRVTISGMNDRAFLDAEFIANPDELQRVLLALTTRNLNISAIRNHLVDEHPQTIFVRVWGRGTALELAKSVRYVLDAEAGAARTGN